MDQLTRYPETMPTGLMAQIALADLDLAAVSPGTEVRLVDGVPVTIVGDLPIDDAIIRSELADMRRLLDGPPHRMSA